VDESPRALAHVTVETASATARENLCDGSIGGRSATKNAVAFRQVERPELRASATRATARDEQSE